MSRKSKPVKKESVLDPVYKSKLVGQIISKILLGGKKSKAEGIVYGSLKILEDKTKEDPSLFFIKTFPSFFFDDD